MIPDFEDNVFINCPFDIDYALNLQAIIIEESLKPVMA